MQVEEYTSKKHHQTEVVLPASLQKTLSGFLLLPLHPCPFVHKTQISQQGHLVYSVHPPLVKLKDHCHLHWTWKSRIQIQQNIRESNQKGVKSSTNRMGPHLLITTLRQLSRKASSLYTNDKINCVQSILILHQ